MKYLFFISLFLFIHNTTFSQDEQATQFYNSGIKKYNNGDYSGSIEDFTKAIVCDPNNPEYYVKRSMAYIILEKYDAAIADYTHVIKSKPYHYWAYLSRGSAYLKTGKYDLAIADFNRVLEIDPENCEAYNNRGWAKKHKGDLQGACEDWNISKKKGNEEAKLILKNTHCK